MFKVPLGLRSDVQVSAYAKHASFWDGGYVKPSVNEATCVGLCLLEAINKLV